MKLSFLLVLIGTLSLSAGTIYSQEAKLSLNLENVTISELLRKLGEKTDYTFLYNDKVMADQGKVSVNVKDKSVEAILAIAFKSHHLSYSIKDKTIFVYKADDMKANESTMVYQKRKVRGSVTDATTGESLPGVNVVVEGTNVGTTTEEDGHYVIEIPDNGAVLVFTYIGYITEKVEVTNKNILDVRLAPNVTDLDEVVVVGYGSQKKISVVGSIETLNPKQLQVGSTRSVSNNLAGQIAGVIAVTRSGEPGYDNSNFWIRGISSFSGSTTPLVLVDGIERDLNNIDPAEIESFSVLKDASASAMYGVRGANGVIIINTKRGKVGPPNVNLRVEHSISEPTMLPKFIGGADYMELLNELKEDKTHLPYSQEQIDKTRYGYDKDLYPDVNWLDAVTNDYAYSTRGNLTVSGGSKFLRYSLVSSLYNEKGIIATDNKLPYNTGIKLDRYNMRANVDLDITRTTTFRLNVGGYMQNRRGPKVSIDNVLGAAFVTSPIVYPGRYSDGTIPVITYRDNPWAMATQSGYQVDINTQLQSLISIEQNFKMITPGLKAKFTFSFDSYNYSGRNRQYHPTYYRVATDRDAEGNLIHDVLQTGDDALAFQVNRDGDVYGKKNLYLEGSLMYFRTFGKSDIDALLLYNQQSYDEGTVQPFRKQGFAGRLSYVYSNRYIAEFNFGYNGSENFENGHRFGFFPSVALGWRISEEPFMQGLRKTVDKLKIRGSYGKVGNDNIGSNRRFAYMTTVFTNQGKYNWGDNGQVERSGITEGEVGVSNLTWETALKSDIGLELGLWNSLELQVDVFREKRSNIFLSRSTIPTQAGYITTPYANYGKVTNQGIDGSLNYSARLNDTWSAGFRSTFSYAINEVTERDEPESRKGTYRAQTGRSMNTLWGLQAERLFTADDFDANGQLKFGIPNQVVGSDMIRPGDIKYKDMDGDGQITEADEGYIGGTVDPRIVFGFGGNLVFRNLDLNVFFQGVADSYRIIGNSSYFIPGSGQGLLGNIYSNYQDRWTEDNPSQDVFWPRLTESPNKQNYRPSTWWKKDMSFLRVKTIELGYTLPKSLVNKIYFKSVRFYVTGNNLFCFSKFKLWDPELNSGDGLKYPAMRSVMFGIDINFK